MVENCYTFKIVADAISTAIMLKENPTNIYKYLSTREDLPDEIKEHIVRCLG